ncbi:MAG: GTP-binding protein [Quisquiliibacterium sp.]
MTASTVSAVRNVVLLGHTGSGKTSLVEAMLAHAGAIPAAGSIEKGTTVCDFDPLERQFGHSLQSSLVNFAWDGHQVYLADTPGMPDFSGQSLAALSCADTALLVIDAQAGIQPTTERLMRQASARNICRMIVVNRIDAENIDLPGLLRDIRERFGNQCLLLDLPARRGKEVVEVLEHDSGEADFDSVAAAHRALIDQIVEEDEDLLARYLEDGNDPDPAELHAPIE